MTPLDPPRGHHAPRAGGGRAGAGPHADPGHQPDCPLLRDPLRADPAGDLHAAGNIAQQILRYGSTPVLLLRPTPGGDAPTFACGDVVVALDPGGHGVSALVLARILADACGARLHLVAVVPTPGALPPERRAAAIFSPLVIEAELEIERQDVEARLRDVVESVTARGPVATLQMRRGDPVHEVANSLTESGADLLVVAPHGRAGRGGWLTGSFGPRILSRSSIPVLFVRSPEPRQAPA